MTEIVIHNKTYKIYEFTGVVVDTSKQRELHVHGSGGGGAVVDGYGGSAPININSSTTVHDNFFLLNEEDNIEKDIKLQNWDVSLRSGHTIQVIWVIAPNHDRGPYTVVNNKNLNQITWSENALTELTKNHYKIQFWSSILGSLLIAFIFKSFIVFIILVLIAFFWWNKKIKELRADLITAITKQIT